jgi:hypothetical protein
MSTTPAWPPVPDASAPPAWAPAAAERVTLHRPPRGWRRFTPLAAWGFLGAVTAYVLTYNPTDSQQDLTGPCVFHETFGIDGPGCGGTRMFYHLIHGDLVEAARHHLVALVGLLYGLYALVAWTAGWIFGKRLPIWRPSLRAIVIYIAVFLIYAVVLRNLPWAPFNWFYVENLT